MCWRQRFGGEDLPCGALSMLPEQLGKLFWTCGKKNILPDRANRARTFAGTPGSSSQPVGLNGRMRQETRGMWRNHRFFSHGCGKCTQRGKDQGEIKS